MRKYKTSSKLISMHLLKAHGTKKMVQKRKKKT